MTIKARGKGFQAKLMLSGARYVAQFNTRADAEAWEADCRGAHARGKPVPAPHGATKTSSVQDMGQLVTHTARMHWATKKSGASLATNAHLFVEWCGPKVSVSQALTAENIDAYVRWREVEKRNSSATINRHLSAISVLIKYAMRFGLLDKPIELPWQREGQGRLRYYEDHELTAIIATVEGWGRQGYADLFMFLADTGARLGEAEKLTWGDIRGKSITFEDTKSGHRRTVTGTPRVMEAFERRRENASTGPFSWLNRQNLRTTWDHIRAHLNLGDECVIHTFRHTCASRLVQRGVDPVRVQKWMGHANITTTMRYAHLAPKHLEELADVLAS